MLLVLNHLLEVSLVSVERMVSVVNCVMKFQLPMYYSFPAFDRFAVVYAVLWLP